MARHEAYWQRRAERLPDNLRQLVMYIDNRKKATGEAPSIAQMAIRFDCVDTTIDNRLRDLRQRGVIKCVPNKERDQNGRWRRIKSRIFIQWDVFNAYMISARRAFTVRAEVWLANLQGMVDRRPKIGRQDKQTGYVDKKKEGFGGRKREQERQAQLIRESGISFEDHLRAKFEWYAELHPS